MLTKITINNFKNFDKNFTFNLQDIKQFDFNEQCIKNNTINKALIYGQNACGKSNLGFAIFDLISHLTDKENGSSFYNNYQNANNDSDLTTFKFEFMLSDNKIEYEYSKKSFEQIQSEKLIINNKEFASINRDESSLFTSNALGIDTLNKDMGDSQISILKYIVKNGVLDTNDKYNLVFQDFISFVNSMLYFRSLDKNNYIGFAEGSWSISDDIIKNGYLENFEKFLNDAGIKCSLKGKDINGTQELYFIFENKEIKFFEIASSGTKALALFYVWFQKLKINKNIKFVFIDEFDAFYHFKLSKLIIERLKEITDTQIILTTHNTSLLSNDLLRPDCYFLMYPDKIKSLSNSTVKELRKAHNIEKMYKAGAFV